MWRRISICLILLCWKNIRLGRLTATDEEVIEAAKKAQCMEFIEKLPQGIHSMAGDAGKMLSGGQRQRISLARAILKDAPHCSS